MKRRPWPLIVLAALHFLAPLGNKVTGAYLAQMDFMSYLQLWWHYATPVMIIAGVILPLLGGLLILICRRWSYYLYLLMIAFLLIYSIQAAFTHNQITAYLFLGLIVVFDLLVVSYFMVPIIRSIYFDPRMRWWESANRYRLETLVTFDQNGQSHQGRIANFSSTGLFINCNFIPSDETEISLNFSYGGVEIVAKGVVIHHGQMNRLGFGVQFLPSTELKHSSNKLVAVLDKEGLKIRDRLPGPEDSFIHWLKTLLTTGKGLVPEKKFFPKAK